MESGFCVMFVAVVVAPLTRRLDYYSLCVESKQDVSDTQKKARMMCAGLYCLSIHCLLLLL